MDKLLTAKEACAEIEKAKNIFFEDDIQELIARVIKCEGVYINRSSADYDVVLSPKYVQKLEELGYKYEEYKETFERYPQKTPSLLNKFGLMRFESNIGTYKRYKLSVCCCENKDNG